ncbi:MAG: hypothetical protein AABY07_04900, partial [Nanoarchaeota archaeon]
WLDSDCGLFSVVSLEEILEYRGQLNKLLDVDCDLSYKDFEEGIYPIDCSVENIRKLVLEEVPNHLDELIKWEHEFEKVGGCVNRWNLYILGHNCD